MPDISELVLSMVKPLVEFPDDVRIDVSESDEFMEYTLRVNPQDIGRVIGKQGRVARAIRRMTCSVRTHGAKHVRLRIGNLD